MSQMLRVLLISIFFIVILPVLAQDLDESYEWEDEGITVDYPDDWDDSVDDNDIVHLSSDETDVFIIFDDYDEDDDIEDYIEDVFDTYTFDSLRFDEDDVLISELDDFDLSASYFYTDELDNEEFERAIVAIPLDDEIIAIAVIVPITDDEIEEIDLVFDILATLTVIGSNSSSDEDTYEFDNDYRIILDNGWAEDDELFSNGDLDVIFYFFDVDFEREDTRAAAMREVFTDVSSIDYDEDFVYFLELDNDDNAIAYYYQDEYYSMIVAFSTDDDMVIVAVAIPSDEDDTEAVFDYEQELYDFLATMED